MCLLFLKYYITISALIQQIFQIRKSVDNKNIFVYNMKLKFIFKLMVINMSENNYKTKQRSVILQCLKENCERSYTIDEIVELLRAQGETVGRTTVYRYIESLSKSGQVRRFAEGGKKSATFQFMSNHEDCEEHMHLKCINCGKLIHLGCDFMNGVCGHIEQHHNFRVDNSKTTILGVCEDCFQKGENR